MSVSAGIPIHGVVTMARRSDSAIEAAKDVFRRHGGVLRTSGAIRAGIHPRTLYAMRDRGDVQRLGRGLYRLGNLPPVGNPDLVAVSLRVPSGVVCLIVAAVTDVCVQQVEPDGTVFDDASVEATRIAGADGGAGARVRFRAYLGTARVAMRIDVSSGDIVTPAPERLKYPTILGLFPPELQGYTRESAVAEKLEAMVSLGVLNSRMEDFHDVWLLSRQFEFDGSVLVAAISSTFVGRGKLVPADPVAFATDATKAAQWRGFIRKSRLGEVPGGPPEAVAVIEAFLAPVARAVAAGEDFGGTWEPPGPWASSAGRIR